LKAMIESRDGRRGQADKHGEEVARLPREVRLGDQGSQPGSAHPVRNSDEKVADYDERRESEKLIGVTKHDNERG